MAEASDFPEAGIPTKAMIFMERSNLAGRY